MKPKKIFLVRHGESEGNVDKNIYKAKPDYALLLTEKGVREAKEAGGYIKHMIRYESLGVYHSPFFRTIETTGHILGGTPAIHYTFVQDQPRLREQEWCGKLREDGFMHEAEAERDAYGHFYYRFDGGESCADVYDRMSSFFNTLHRDFEKKDFPENVLIVSHGMTMRLFIMRWFHLSVEEFESLANPRNGEVWQMIRLHNDKYKLITQLKKYDKPRHSFQYPYIHPWMKKIFYNMWTDIKRIDSSNEHVSKYVFNADDAVAEAVLYKYPTYEDRTVICCSTQSGCPVGCRFCGAGDYFVRSLTEDEIVSQPVHLLEQTLIKSDAIKKLQIMFMSMGEPMLNYDALRLACVRLYMMYPHARLLISTSAPRKFDDFRDLNRLSVVIPTIGLQFSVHESSDEARRRLIPTPTMTLHEIAVSGVEWFHACGRRPFFNYCVHPNNNTQEDVSRLRSYFNPEIWEATLSVICERDEHVAAANERQRTLVSEFMDKMLKMGYSTRMFDPAGQDDIGGGCGQLWFVQDWMKEHPDKARASKGCGLPKVHTPRANE